MAPTKPRMSSKELADSLWLSCKDLNNGLYSRLRTATDGTRLAIQHDDLNFILEIFILNLWAISKVLKADTKALDELHQIFLSGQKALAPEGSDVKEHLHDAHLKLLARYERFYKAWNDSAANPMEQLVFCGTALDSLFGRDSKAGLDMNLLTIVLTHIAAVMNAVRKNRMECDVVDAP